MLFIMNFLIGGVFFCGLSLAKSSWIKKGYLKAIGIMLVNIIVCIILILVKESMKAETRKSLIGYFLFNYTNLLIN